MFDQTGHLTDEVLIRLIDDEPLIVVADEVRVHCAECFVCRSRRSQLEQALTKFADLYSSATISTMQGSGLERRVELQNRLAVAGLTSQPLWPGRFTRPLGYLFVAMAIVVIAVVAVSRRNAFMPGGSTSAKEVLRLLPDKELTPGDTHPVDLADLCSQREEDLDPSVPDPVRKIVFQEYGMGNTQTDGYQVDYLINPQLGGTADVRNLWPESYDSSVWNAHAKDALEERLHRMVCDNQIDLADAQHEIATDWIAAYKKYFHAESLPRRPIT